MRYAFKIREITIQRPPGVSLLAVLLILFYIGTTYAQEQQFPDIPAVPAIDGQDLDVQENKKINDIAEATVAPAAESDPRVDRGNLSFYEWDLPDPRTIPSLFFTPWTQALIKEYRGYIHMNPDTGGGGDDEVRQPGVRELALGGISYRGEDDWTIWLNGQRITPKALPDQIHDLSVTGEYVDIKWYDSYTNIIFPVRLRPHQRFNLDTRIFLPG